jgi:hypothetical protein
MIAGKTTPVQNSAQGKTRDIVAKKSGFGSKENLRKYEKIKERTKNEKINYFDYKLRVINRM